MEQLINLDKELFLFLNGLGSEQFDSFWQIITKQIYWSPLFIGVFYLIQKKVGWKGLGIIILFLAALITFTDQMTNLFKNHFQRLRPCNDPALIGKTRLLLDHCSGGFSFTSSHAANHFGIAIFIFMTWGITQQRYTKFFFVWAGIIAFAQIYVGVHYPLDIIGGTIIGLISGFAMAKAYLKWAGPMLFKQA